jgi:hypothetical protein
MAGAMAGPSEADALTTAIGGKIRVARAFERADTMRLEFMGLPDTLDRSQRKPRSLGHGATRPMGRRARWLGAGHRHYLRHLLSGDRRYAGLARLVSQQPVDALFSEPLLPAPHHRAADANQRCHTLHGDALSRRENHPCSLHMLLLLVAIGHDRIQPGLFRPG